MDGILLVDKPVEVTSFDVVAKVRRALDEKSVGHCGTLDPFATGLLIVVVGKYTRASHYLVLDDKTYEADIFFGAATESGDVEGAITQTGDANFLTASHIEAALTTFLGSQTQIPPTYSAIWVNGERAYHKARRGEVIELSPRPVCFYNLELLQWNKPVAKVRVKCSKGTYVRAFARDLGQKLGVPAHLSGLQRIYCGFYNVKDAIELSVVNKENIDLLRRHLITGKQAFLGLPIIDIDVATAERLKAGQRPHMLLSLDTQITYLAFCDDTPIAFVRYANACLVPVRGF